MPLLQTAHAHFTADLGRARDLVDHAHGHQASTLRDDLFRAGWMMAVGACDAFFCDFYADLLARTLQARQIQGATFQVSDRLLNLRIPAIAAIGTAANANWRWRMAARTIIEDESVLSIKNIKGLLNQFFRDAHKPFSNTNFDAWIVHAQAKSRLFGITATNYRALNGNARTAQRKTSIDQFGKRFAMMFQRRHDCIHNCDRPKAALDTSNLTKAAVDKVIHDIEFLGNRVHEAAITEYPLWLAHYGANAVTRNRVT